MFTIVSLFTMPNFIALCKAILNLVSNVGEGVQTSQIFWHASCLVSAASTQMVPSTAHAWPVSSRTTWGPATSRTSVSSPRTAVPATRTVWTWWGTTGADVTRGGRETSWAVWTLMSASNWRIIPVANKPSMPETYISFRFVQHRQKNPVVDCEVVRRGEGGGRRCFCFFL